LPRKITLLPVRKHPVRKDRQAVAAVCDRRATKLRRRTAGELRSTIAHGFSRGNHRPGGISPGRDGRNRAPPLVRLSFQRRRTRLPIQLSKNNAKKILTAAIVFYCVLSCGTRRLPCPACKRQGCRTAKTGTEINCEPAKFRPPTRFFHPLRVLRGFARNNPVSLRASAVKSGPHCILQFISFLDCLFDPI
jgi:hypothetical protein